METTARCRLPPIRKNPVELVKGTVTVTAQVVHRFGRAAVKALRVWTVWDDRPPDPESPKASPDNDMLGRFGVIGISNQPTVSKKGSGAMAAEMVTVVSMTGTASRTEVPANVSRLELASPTSASLLSTTISLPLNEGSSLSYFTALEPWTKPFGKVSEAGAKPTGSSRWKQRRIPPNAVSSISL